MSNQIVISSGAKLRNLNGVITGTTGVLDSVPLGGANGVATLDSSGKVPVSQLPSSVVTYLGTWNAATNTPTLTNGTGDAGDMYLCNVAGTVNFGAGPITFAVGDWVLYGSGTWQKSNGQNGTVTSVAVTESGDALTITGSPITTSGTINIGFAGTSAQYVAGNGSLITFPALTGYVPYTGATADVDLDTHVLNAQALHVKGTAGAGHLGLKHQTATPTGSANESLLFANVNGDLGWQNDNLHLTTLDTHANTANRVYTFPNASGTVALTSDLSAYVPYTGATSNVDITGNNFSSSNIKINGDNTSNFGFLGFKQFSGGSSGQSGYTSIFAQGTNSINIGFSSTGANKTISFSSSLISSNTTRSYSFPDASGTVALTSDIPSLSGYVPYTGATSDVNLGNYALTTSNTVFTPVLFSTYLYGGTTLVASPMTISTSDLVFQTGTAGGSSWSQKMVLTAAGNLGINTTTPSYLLDVNGTGRFTGALTTNGLFTIDQTNGGTILLKTAGSSYGLFANTYNITGSGSTSDLNAYVYGANSFGIYTNGTKQLTITSTGAATFSSSVTAVSTMQLANDGTYGSTYKMLAFTGNTNGSHRIFAGTSDDMYICSSDGRGIQFWTNGTTGAGVPKLNITSAGNVGIGTSSPSANLHVKGSTTSVIYAVGASNAYRAEMQVEGAGQFTGSFVAIPSSSSTYGGIPTSTIGITTSSTDFVLATSNTERMRITSGGNVLVNTTTDDGVGKVSVVGPIAARGSSAVLYFQNQVSSNYFAWYGNVNIKLFNQDVGVIGQFAYNTGAYTALSDINKKKDFEDSTIGLNAIMCLKPTLFRMKDEEGTEKHLGFIAQQVKEFIPQAYVESDDMIGLQDRPIIAALVKAIQELKAEIDELKNK